MTAVNNMSLLGSAVDAKKNTPGGFTLKFDLHKVISSHRIFLLYIKMYIFLTLPVNGCRKNELSGKSAKRKQHGSYLVFTPWLRYQSQLALLIFFWVLHRTLLLTLLTVFHFWNLQELIEKLSKGELPKEDFPCMNDPSPSFHGSTSLSSAATSSQGQAAQSMRSRRTPTWAKPRGSDDGYSRYCF